LLSISYGHWDHCHGTGHFNLAGDSRDEASAFSPGSVVTAKCGVSRNHLDRKSQPKNKWFQRVPDILSRQNWAAVLGAVAIKLGIKELGTTGSLKPWQ
jgi:hypothetical protein